MCLRPEGTVGQGRAGLRACINRKRSSIFKIVIGMKEEETGREGAPGV